MSNIRQIMRWNLHTPINVRSRQLGNSIENLYADMQDMFGRFMDGMNVYMTDWDERTPAMPAVDVIENDKNFTVKVALPGVQPSDIEVEASDGFLTIKGSSKEEKEEKKKDYLRREMSSGYFARTMSLPDTADCNQAQASFRNGMLTVEIAKKAGALQKPKKITVKQAA